MALPMTDEQRLAHYDVDADSGCWNWRGNVSGSGYGRFPQRGTRKMIQAHRYFYESMVGSVPDGKFLDHLCRNRQCVNPDHLEVVTNRENTRRGDSTILTKEQVETIRSCDMTDREVASAYGIAENTAFNLLNGRGWDDVPLRRRPVVNRRFKLADANVLLLRIMAITTNGIPQREIGETFGVTHHTAWATIQGRTRSVDYGKFAALSHLD